MDVSGSKNSSLSIIHASFLGSNRSDCSLNVDVFKYNIRQDMDIKKNYNHQKTSHNSTAIHNYIKLNWVTSLNSKLTAKEIISMANQSIAYHSILELLLHSLGPLKQYSSHTIPWTIYISSNWLRNTL